jgi:hypothetical protein
MKRMFGLMPANEVEIEKNFLGGERKIIIQAGKKGWTIIWADGSTDYRNFDDSGENNFNSAISHAKIFFPNIVEIDIDDEMGEC